MAASGHHFPSIHGLSNRFKVRGPLARLTVEAPRNAAVGAPFGVKVSAYDEVGNHLVDFSGDVSLDNTTHSLSNDPLVFHNGDAIVQAQIGSPATTDRITASGPGGVSGASKTMKVTGSHSTTPPPTTLPPV